MKHKPEYVVTNIYLPPGALPTERVYELLRRMFEEYRWFRPVRFGYAFMDGALEPKRVDYETLAGLYEKRKLLRVEGQGERESVVISPSKSSATRSESEFPYGGKIRWTASLEQVSRPEWRAAHLRQVQELMSFVGSPLAQAGLDGDFRRKMFRFVPGADGVSQREEVTLRDYSEGLSGLYWRNFLGGPFVRLFGERLDALPAECRQEFSEELVLVQPYELPTQAGTPEGEARERQLISVLGPECFYDHEHHVKPVRCPPLGPVVH